MTRVPEHVTENRRYWNSITDQWVMAGERAWGAEPRWGIWGTPEADLGLIPTDMTGTRALELGCGTGHVSAWMAMRWPSVSRGIGHGSSRTSRCGC